MIKVKARIQDVAKKAGVSVSTVSRFLNGGKDVSEKAKVLINNAIHELNFSPNYMARTLVKRKSNLIGVIIPDIKQSFDSTILYNIEEYTTMHNYNLAICNIAESLDKECDYLRHLSQMNICGLIIMNEKWDDRVIELIKEMQIPTVFCSCIVDGVDATSIVVDDYQAARDATKYLIELNHKRIAFIGGDMRDETSRKRFRGFQKVMSDANIQPDEQYIKFGDYKIDSGYLLMKELLSSSPRPTAIFAASDDMAVGALNCIIDNGLLVPDDFSIIGFDGSYLGEIVRPSLTTLKQPIQQMGEMSVQVLIDQLNGKSQMVNQIILRHELLIRDSCRKL